jgi:hypothetical protein
MTVPNDFDLFYREGMAFGEQFAQGMTAARR